MILDSTLVTLCISLGCVFLGVLVFTRSTHLSLIVMLVVMMIVLGLLFFMVIAGPLLRCVYAGFAVRDHFIWGTPYGLRMALLC